ncbi:MAG: DUF3494 domain-containing protein [Zetaproteobacteria bacterium]|nr:DUF3494 domain-containing protein [Zetaproteobacteria bacterium]
MNLNLNIMNAKKFLTALAFASVVLISGCAKDDFVEINGVCPVVVTTIPTNLATGVPLNQIISATFNDKMNPSTITSSSFFIKQGATLINGVVSYVDTTATFTPSANLSPNTVYTGTVTTMAKNLKGLYMQEDYVWTFTTIPQLLLFSNPIEGGNTSGAGTFVNGATVTAIATPNSGYTFFSWSENGIIIPGAEANYSFIMNGNRSLIANFSAVIPQFTVGLTVNPFNGGTTNGAGAYNSGASVTVSAFPSIGFTFTNWKEDANIVSSNMDYTFTINGDRNLEANFTAVIPQFTVGLTANPLNGGTTNGAGTFNSGASVTVSATPASGFTFTNWKEGANIVSSNMNYTFTLDGNRDLVANFTAIASGFTLNVTAVHGSVTKNPNQLTYNNGDDVILTASPDAGYEFSSWSGDASGTSNPLTITMNADKNVTANFTLIPVVSCTPAVDLGLANGYAILAESGISTTGVTSITGNMGISPQAASFITGFGLILPANGTSSTSSLVTGSVFAADYAEPTPTLLTTTVDNMHTAFTTANGLASTVTEFMAGNLNGQTLVPGVYKWSNGISVTNGITLDGGADDCASWVFQIAGDLTIADGAIITLQNGAHAKNIFWVVAGSGAMLGTTVQFEGNILSKTLISLNTGAKVNGRLLAQTAVTLDASTVVKPQ